MSHRPEEETKGAGGDTSTDDPELEAEREMARRHHSSSSEGGLAVRDLKLRTFQRTKSGDDEPAPMQINGMIQVPRGEKNMRRSRCKGRGTAKKDGAGGKFTWGVPGRVYEESDVDPDDPNYDSDAQGNVTFDEMDPELTEDQLTKYADPFLQEYFENGDLRETVDALRRLTLSSSARPALVRLLLADSLDHRQSARELASELVAELVGRRVIVQSEMAHAFVALLNDDLPDLAIDYPMAAEVCGNFIARAVADMALPTDFVSRLLADKDSTLSNPIATAALVQAEVMSCRKFGLNDIWGMGGAQKPVRVLTRQMQLLIQEYLTSNDSAEAARCLRELEVPHFHHELVFQAGVMAIEAMHERVSHWLARLLQALAASGELTADAIEKGFERLFVALHDLSVDVPPAYTLAERWCVECQAAGFLPAAVGRRLPQKGRKRFVSEGDGGRLKVIDVAHPLI